MGYGRRKCREGGCKTPRSSAYDAAEKGRSEMAKRRGGGGLEFIERHGAEQVAHGENAYYRSAFDDSKMV
jgi:hypothetical protein